MGNGAKSGGDPQTLGQCSVCENIYPVQRTADGELRPIGTEGGCECGNDEFVLVTE